MEVYVVYIVEDKISIEKLLVLLLLKKKGIVYSLPCKINIKYVNTKNQIKIHKSISKMKRREKKENEIILSSVSNHLHNTI